MICLHICIYSNITRRIDLQMESTFKPFNRISIGSIIINNSSRLTFSIKRTEIESCVVCVTLFDQKVVDRLGTDENIKVLLQYTYVL